MSLVAGNFYYISLTSKTLNWSHSPDQNSALPHWSDWNQDKVIGITYKCGCVPQKTPHQSGYLDIAYTWVQCQGSINIAWYLIYVDGCFWTVITCPRTFRNRCNIPLQLMHHASERIDSSWVSDQWSLNNLPGTMANLQISCDLIFHQKNLVLQSIAQFQ